MEVCYCYDGSFYGFLTCVFLAYQHREPPAAFRTPEDCPTLWEERQVDTQEDKAKRVLNALREKVSPQAQVLVRRGFLTCMDQRELALYSFIRFALNNGPKAMAALAHPAVGPIMSAVRYLEHEAHLYTGFLRFSDQDGVLVGEIEPKNQVLPLIQGHFCGRLNTECFVIHDRTNHQALFHKPGRWAVIPVEDFQVGAANGEELRFRALWRTFYDTVAIEGRINPKLQRNNLPLRYRHLMTEFQPDGTALPARE